MSGSRSADSSIEEGAMRWCNASLVLYAEADDPAHYYKAGLLRNGRRRNSGGRLLPDDHETTGSPERP
jgi:hypothetical protein